MFPIRPQYEFLGLNPEQGFNKTFFIQRSFNFFGIKLFKSLWIGKITKKLSLAGADDLFDMNQRSALASDLGKILGVNIAQTKIIKTKSIDNFGKVCDLLGDLNNYYDFTEIPISKFKDKRINEKTLPLIKSRELLSLFIFDCWIGNLDKKTDDYVIDDKNRLWGIDYQLWGPRDESDRTLGYCACLYDLTPENLKRFCLPELLWNNIVFTKKIADKIIGRIEYLNQKILSKLVNHYKFINNRGEIFNKEIINYLYNRTRQIKKEINEIFKIQ